MPPLHACRVHQQAQQPWLDARMLLLKYAARAHGAAPGRWGCAHDECVAALCRLNRTCIIICCIACEVRGERHDSSRVETHSWRRMEHASL